MSDQREAMTMVVDNTLPRMTISKFCENNSIAIRINERPHLPEGSPERYYASLDGIECIFTPGCLRSRFSDGRTKQEAIDGLRHIYTNVRLVRNAFRSDRREFGPIVFVAEVIQ